MTRILRGVTVLATFLAGTAAASAQSAGAQEYMNYCASCHGESAMGDGPIAPLLTVDVPDLTKISERNDGEFPLLHVIQVIDGRTGIRGHGFPMPVWGSRFAAEAQAEAPPGAGPHYENELLVRGRILALALYLESIQE
ncbi:c-type cytochrome [Roseibacterium sp. SDUM158017]|uniref:c-type cytochrome n=1 Tax=Roseicyclus salinarum TaxID=3036773 RepID=UPI002415716E|nr:c-type cytochrome [Roseibacterium sp. SDUM158017]MDG4650424.1 c-type cytochrome [Roseibacterium sp. SDUM158017]